MSQNKKIQVDPQELRDLGTHFHHVGADIQQIVTDLRNATAGLDTGCWTGDEAARLTARFAEAETLGRRRAAAHAELGDLLLRAGDAFEEADATALQQIMGMPAGWMEPSPVVPGAGKTLNSTALSTQMPAPASLLTTENGTGGEPEPTWWESLLGLLNLNWLEVFTVYVFATGLLMLAMAATLTVLLLLAAFGVISVAALGGPVGVAVLAILAILAVILGGIIIVDVGQNMTLDLIVAALGWTAAILVLVPAILTFLVLLKVIVGGGLVLGTIVFMCLFIAFLLHTIRIYLPILSQESLSTFTLPPLVSLLKPSTLLLLLRPSLKLSPFKLFSTTF